MTRAGDILEKLLKINDKDINLIFKPLAPWVKRIRTALTKKKWSEAHEISRGWQKLLDKPLATIKSDQLTSSDCKKAHGVKPCTIMVGFPGKGNVYFPDKAVITVGIPYDIMDVLDKVPNFDRFTEYVQEFAPERIKGSIRHELSHWVDDALHNQHLAKRVSRAKEAEAKGASQADVLGIMRDKKPSSNLTEYEINAVIHAIVAHKKANRSTWDQMSFDDLMKLAPGMLMLNRELGLAWRKQIKKRMAREKLLGKKMR